MPDVNWISARDALRKLCPSGAHVEVQRAISSAILARARAGLRRTHAAWFELNGEEKTDCDIPAEVWRPSADRIAQNWITGDFSFQGHPLAKNPMIWMALGVTFADENLSSLVTDDGPGEVALDFIATGSAGSPTARAAFLQIFEERSAAGITLGSLKSEADAVAGAYASDPRYPRTKGWPPAKPATVKNNIRDAFNSIKARPE